MMKPAFHTARALAATLVTVGLTACSLFRGAHHEAPPPPAPPAPPAAAVPTETQRFELAPDQDVVGVVQVTTTTKDDTLTDIARRFNVGYEEILRANPKVDPWLPGADKDIVIPTQFILPNAPHEGIVINIAAMRLFYFPKHKPNEPQEVITHPIGIGKVGWATPEGVTHIVRRQKDPTWTVPVSVLKEHHENGEDLDRVIGPGPDNPLGRHAFYLEWPSYLIHGTNKPAGVGLRSSHGCIRLFPEDIAQLFEMVPVGTQVRVVNQPFVFGWRDGQLYMQAFDVLEDDPRDWKKAQKKLLTKSLAATLQKQLKSHNEQVNWDLVGRLSHEPRGVPVAISAGDGSVEQIVAGAPKVQNRIPDGSTWDGKTDLPMDEATFRQVVSEMDPNAPASAPPSSRPAKPPEHPGLPTT
ncbi:MAG TPA: L,D-transpeptidase family protein [Steroidobacteraceae bacterium]|nr:L,D-transpeptidase family protein [Steroidobacteraceae bacterium]